MEPRAISFGNTFSTLFNSPRWRTAGGPFFGASLSGILCGSLTLLETLPGPIALLLPFLLLPYLAGVKNTHSVFWGGWYGLLFGIFAYGSGAYWVVLALRSYRQASWIFALGFSLCMFFVFAFPFGLFGALLGKKPSSVAFALSGWLMIEFFFAEWLPWTPACCFLLSPAQAQWAGVFGRYGLMLFLIGFSFWIRSGHKSWIVAYLVFLLGGELLNQFWKQTLVTEKRNCSMTSVWMVQAGITRTERKTGEGIKQGLERLHRLTDTLSINNATLVLWPEGSVDESDPNAKCFSKASVLFGLYARRFSSDSSLSWVENQIVLNAENTDSQSYLKRRLTPIGEKSPIPGLNLFSPSPPYRAGTSANLIFWKTLQLGGLICYEDLFPDLAAESTRSGATVLVALTNDVWFEAPAVALHTRLARLRAIENRRFFLRCNNTGPSEIIAPDGSVQLILAYQAVGGACGEVFPRTENSCFTAYFSRLPWLGWLFPILFFFHKKPRWLFFFRGPQKI